MFIVFPSALFFAIIALAKIRSARPAETIIKAFALLLLLTMASAHLTKSILKMTSRIPYWRYALSEPAGIMTAQKILDGRLVLDKSVPNALYSTTSFVTAALFLIALLATLWIFRKSATVKNLDLSTKAALLLGVLVYWGIFGLTILKWRF